MLELTVKPGDAQRLPLEAECIRPDTLAGLSLAAITELPIRHGNRFEPLKDHFDIAGDPSDARVIIHGDCSRFKHLGAGMASGQLTIHGNVGMHLGAAMTGGTIRVEGNVGDWLGAEMRGGEILIHGDAGNLVGAAYRGGRHGMRGGEILIHGDAGHEVGFHLRRGLIAIGGCCGAFLGVSMIAGTIVAFGPTEGRVGAGLKRGTIVLTACDQPLVATFAADRIFRPVFLNLILKRLQSQGFPIPTQVQANAAYQRYSGDRLLYGKGEILRHLDPAIIEREQVNQPT